MDSQFVDRGGARVGALGRFEQARLGELLQPWILEDQLRRRVPSAALYTYAPDGADGPLALDGGLVTANLGTYDEEHLDRLASEVDVLVVVGPVALDTSSDAPGDASRFFVEGLGEAREARVPTAWHAVTISTPIGAAAAKRLRDSLPRRSYVSVVSGESLAALRKAGVKRKVEVVPDPLLLASEVFPAATLDRRLRYLRSQGWLPGEGRPVVLDASALLEIGDERFLTKLRALAAREGLEFAVLETAPGDDGEGAVALAETLGTPWRVPRAASITDLLAAISGASLFVTCSVEGEAIARSFGVRAFSPERPERRRKGRADGAALERALREPAATLGAEERARLDGHFDRLAEIVRSARTAPGTEAVPAHLGLWRALAESRTRQLAEQRLRLAEQIERTESESRERVERAEAHANISLGEKQRVEEELATSLRALERFRQDLDWSRMETHRQSEAADAAKAGVEAAKAEAVRATEAELEKGLSAASKRAEVLETELRAVHERAAANIAAQEQAHARTIAVLEEVQAREASLNAELQKALRAQADAHRQFEAQDSALRVEVQKAQRAYAEAIASVREHEAQEKALRAEAEKAQKAYAGMLATAHEHEAQAIALRTEMEKAQRAHAEALTSVSEHENQEKALRAEVEKAQRAYAEMLASVRRHEAEVTALRAELEKAQRAHAEALASLRELDTREGMVRAELRDVSRERTRLDRELAAAQHERDELRANAESWRLAFLRVEGEVADTNRREADARERLHAEHVQRQEESERERLQLESERDALTSERDALTSERDALTSERDTLIAQRDRLHGELTAMAVEFRRTLNLRLFRYTAPVRALYKKVRGLTVSH